MLKKAKEFATNNKKKIALFFTLFLAILFAFSLGYIFGAKILEPCQIIIQKR